MYHWNIEALCNDLAKERLPEPQAMMYLLNTTIVITIPIYGYTSMSQPWVLWAEFFMGIAGILLAYYFNGGAKGKDFLARLASIGWVSTIRASAFSLIIMVIYILLLKIFSESPPKNSWDN